MRQPDISPHLSPPREVHCPAVFTSCMPDTRLKKRGCDHNIERARIPYTGNAEVLDPVRTRKRNFFPLPRTFKILKTSLFVLGKVTFFHSPMRKPGSYFSRAESSVHFRFGTERTAGMIGKVFLPSSLPIPHDNAPAADPLPPYAPTQLAMNSSGPEFQCHPVSIASMETSLQGHSGRSRLHCEEGGK